MLTPDCPALKPDCPALNDVETPALVIDAVAMDANIAKMAATARAHSVGLRPHAKTHKSGEIARRQLAAGASGVCCATVLEAEALAADGATGILITAPAMGASKFERVARLSQQQPLMVVVDHMAQVDELRHVLGSARTKLGVLVDVDVGHARTGVVSTADAVAIAKAIAATQSMTFAGLQGYAGHAQHIPEPLARRESALAAGRLLASYVTALTAAGLPPRIVSGSGTGAHLHDTSGPYTELQAGSYVFMDADYARILDESGAGPKFAPSLFVLATVVSVNRTGFITVDAGTKALAVNGPPPRHLVGLPEGSTYKFTGDEHGTIALPHGHNAPLLGTRVLIGATHCDPTVNLHACYHVVEDADQPAARWPILGRYGGLA